MKVITKMTVMRDIALVTLSKVPASVDYICRIFDMLDEAGVNVDRISQLLALPTASARKSLLSAR